MDEEQEARKAEESEIYSWVDAENRDTEVD